MKLGMTIEPFKGISVGQVVSLARKIKLDHIETNKRIAPYVEEVISNLGKITTTFHLPIYIRDGFDMGSKGKSNEEKIQEVITFINKYKEELNMTYTLSHPPEALDSTSERLIERLGQIETPIILENIMGQTDEDFIEFYFNAKDRLGKKLVGHAIDAPHRYVTDWENWLNIPKELLKEIVYVHISDCTKKVDLHRPLGLGTLPFNDFFELLKKINYQGVILQELLPNGDQLEEILNSCLHCIKPFSKNRYRKMKLKFAIIRPILQWKIYTRFRELQKRGNGVLAKDLAFDFV